MDQLDLFDKNESLPQRLRRRYALLAALLTRSNRIELPSRFPDEARNPEQFRTLPPSRSAPTSRGDG